MVMKIWSLKTLNFLAAATLTVGLAGCGTSHYAAQPGSNHPFSNSALGNEVFLDGTGSTSRRTGSNAPMRVQAEAPPPGAPTQAVARSRPLAIERSDAVSGSTTGARVQAQNDPNKPFSDAWWERERIEDARLKQRMNICRGC
jgi:hypothetical protein